ncbi:MAG: histidine--tRNA ligase [Deltaproteobacteria bacterium]|nr:histidine--tRNA ligase [Deltaproteobacteria bacterium]
MAQKLNTAPPKGSRDFLPGDVRRREHVLSVVRRVYSRYGFEPLETPTMERLETLLGKYGDEGDQLIFRVLHRGETLRSVLAAGKTIEERDLADSGLRYDLTVPLARVYAEHQAELPRFFKRYQIQPVWRADRPAKGRFREFYQCDVDIIGSDSLVCEVEVTSALSEVLDELGFKDAVIRLNHRDLLSGLIEASGIPKELEITAITALDKLDKIGAEGVQKELEGRGVTTAAAQALLQKAALAATATSNDSLLAALAEAVKGSTAGEKGVAELRQLLAYAASAPCRSHLKVDASLARGLSYYTGPIFEIQVPDLAGSLGGGGRYDNLIGMFLGRRVPAVGFSLGLERILVVMEERKMFPPLDAGAEVMVLRVEEATTPETLKVASALRAAGISTELYPNVDKLGRQFQYAAERGAKLAVFIGARERDAGTVAVKVLATQQQSEQKQPELARAVLGLLGRG